MNQNVRRNKLFEKFIGVVVLLVAAGAVTGAGYFYLKSRSTRNWPAVEGVITKSDTRSQRSPGGSGAPTTIADVWYNYVVDGIEYHNDTISLSQYGSGSASHAVEEAHRYPVGSRVMVYYNPENPHDAVLEHKTPWIFIGLFAGLGAILIFIGIGMLSGGFTSSSPAATMRRDRRTPARGLKAPTASGVRLMAAVLLSSALIAVMGFYLFFNEKNENGEGSGQVADDLPERYGPQPVSTYSKAETAPPCGEWLKAQVAESQKIRLDDGLHALYVTATLCIDEEEMKFASQTQRTWPTIARHLAAYEKTVFDPDAIPLDTGGENRSEVFGARLKRIEQECLERLHENGIFFVTEIRFESLQVFEAE
jgi:hypothetical protein